MKRRFEFVEGSSSKFWEVTLADKSVIVRYGRIGTAGHELTKPFAAADLAQRHADGLISQKLAKGYVEIN